ncbi:MAG: hypothetical protein E6423_16975 [Clostridium sp.]|mgnify:CR=1 FL=1|uniref:hypothetical protein n=1 Tax=Clostridium TaxID=1485 RepID=UPI000668D950|nr:MULTISPECIES: hypothetical protein [Clostridium]MDB2107303.1 hypothetical protein [Clostridium paraputrificum]MDB2113860.1 hypothetical protein [Clostridium paraputrificum]MDU5742194.1 hypothetical protein [Clostridium sp.]MDU5786545.1 hypothetical protein [Clostridium sp.]MDU6810440.1 hypothetical protein [Clostridium sp.]
MRVCSKCNAKIGIVSILKSSFKREGILECDTCHAKFKVKWYLLTAIIIIALSCITFSYLNTYYPTTITNYIIRGIIVVTADILIYTVIAFLMPWKEE